MSNEKRLKLKAHYDTCLRLDKEWEEKGFRYPPPATPAFPEELRGMTCGGLSRITGKPCRQRAIYTNGRCKWHGGLSTGPRTAEGKKKVALNGLKGGRPRKKA